MTRYSTMGWIKSNHVTTAIKNLLITKLYHPRYTYDINKQLTQKCIPTKHI